MKLSLPSLDQIGAALLRIYKRFPFVLFVSVIGSASAIWLAELSYTEQDNHPRILALAFCSGLGISFLFGLATFLEQKNWNAVAKYGIQFTGLILLVLYWILLGDTMMEGPSEVWYRFFLFALASHLFVAFAPFLNSGDVDQFWEYNKTLFLRILLSVLYSGVLFVGLSVALLALDNLLDLDVDGETYFQLFLFLGGIFNTWFFLTGVPEKGIIQEKETAFPTGLRVFVQYVLIPLVTVYIIILYLYLGKIILQWELPNGWVSNLVLTFSIAGILSLLLLYPIRTSKEYNWIRIYSKGYYLALIPLIGLLMFSIWVRISEYGVTINRYFVATLGVWLTGIVIYFIISKTKSIKVIPVSLCLIALGVSFGPLGAFAVSERSQLGRFEEILVEYGYLNEYGKAQKSDTKIPFKYLKELSSISYYIVEAHSEEVFLHFFDEGEKDFSVKTWDSVFDIQVTSSNILEAFGIDYSESWIEGDSNTLGDYFSFEIGKEEEYDISGYDTILISAYMGSNQSDKKGSYEISYQQEVDSIQVKNLILGTTINFGIESKINSLINENQLDKRMRNDITPNRMEVITENEMVKGKVLIEKVSGYKSDSLWVKHLRAHILISEKQ